MKMEGENRGPEAATGADIAVHECFASPKILMDRQKFRGRPTALNVGTQVHISPAQSTSRFGSNEQVPHRHDIQFL